jgi:hypothetical protein
MGPAAARPGIARPPARLRPQPPAAGDHQHWLSSKSVVMVTTEHTAGSATTGDSRRMPGYLARRGPAAGSRAEPADTQSTDPRSARPQDCLEITFPGTSTASAATGPSGQTSQPPARTGQKTTRITGTSVPFSRCGTRYRHTANIRSGRPRSGTPVALRNDRWPRPLRGIRRYGRLRCGARRRWGPCRSGHSAFGETAVTAGRAGMCGPAWPERAGPPTGGGSASRWWTVRADVSGGRRR